MAIFVKEKGLCFDDVLLVPQFSEVMSRKDVDTSVKLGTIQLQVPIISSNMASVTEYKMAKAMGELGGASILHRFTDYNSVLYWICKLKGLGLPAIPSIGVKQDDYYLAETYREHTTSICVDVAHGHSKHVGDIVSFLRNKLKYHDIVAGNVATRDGAKYLIDQGANILKIGVGGGAVCKTRIVTGHGSPTLQSILDCMPLKQEYVGVNFIADGGIRNSGDIVKSLAAGADVVMLGSLLSGTDEAPVILNDKGQRVYQGMASGEQQLASKGFVSGTPEGVSIPVANKGPVSEVIKNLVAGLRSGMSYSGVTNIKDLQENALFMQVSSNCVAENGPHGKKD